MLEKDLLKRNNLFPPLFTIINNINGYLSTLYGLELLFPSSGTGTRNCDICRKLATWKNSKILICWKCAWSISAKINIIMSKPVPEKHIYWALHYDDWLAVPIQIYKIKIHRSSIPQDKLAVFSYFTAFFRNQFYVWKLAAVTADMVR